MAAQIHNDGLGAYGSPSPATFSTLHLASPPDRKRVDQATCGNRRGLSAAASDHALDTSDALSASLLGGFSERPIVSASSIGITQHFKGFIQLLHYLGSVCSVRCVRVVLAGKAAVRGLDDLQLGILGYLEHTVVGCRHSGCIASCLLLESRRSATCLACTGPQSACLGRSAAWRRRACSGCPGFLCRCGSAALIRV